MNKNTKNIIILLYLFLVALCLFGIIYCNIFNDTLVLTALISFATIIAAALLIGWGAEAAQFMISQGLAVAIIALLQVLPEFFVEAVIAWSKNVELMLANFTGSNRLLMGLGWPAIFFIYYYVHCFKYKRKPKREIELKEEHSLEILALFAGSLYFIKILLTNKITLFDSFIFIIIFAYYFWCLSKLSPEKEENIKDLIPPPRILAEVKNKTKRAVYVLAIFILSGITLTFIAHPFLESMKAMAVLCGISAFLFVQWVAPFLTEFPEKLTSFYWASRVKLAPMALLNMISSKVNQWTLLIAMVPIVYSLSCRKAMFIPLNTHLNHEVLLTLIMTFYGSVCLLKFKFTRANAFVIFSLWFVQFLIPETRLSTAAAFLFFTLVEVIMHYKDMRFIPALKKTFAHIYKR
ncbi:MAG: hypothetical protein ABIH00_01880 [Armatimonadota bacterium]